VAEDVEKVEEVENLLSNDKRRCSTRSSRRVSLPGGLIEEEGTVGEERRFKVAEVAREVGAGRKSATEVADKLPVGGGISPREAALDCASKEILIKC